MILSLKNVYYNAQAPYEEFKLNKFSFDLNEGEIAIININNKDYASIIGDLIEGLLTQIKGSIIFLENNWLNISVKKAANNRNIIGRVFSGDNNSVWISNLDIDENIILKQKYLSRKNYNKILNEQAYKLANKLGFDALPQIRPNWVNKEQSKRLQWVRALLNNPKLFILEYSEEYVEMNYIKIWFELLKERLLSNSAIICFTKQEALWRDYFGKIKIINI